MDIWLIGDTDSMHLRPMSIHGMLWLQTHFENHHWEELASSQVKLSIKDAKVLSSDAQDAGLNLNFLPALSLADNKL